MAELHLLSNVETGRSPYWKAAAWAGLFAGAVFLVLEMIMVPLVLGDSPWAPVRMMAAILLGQGVLPPPATFDLGVFIAALLVHFVLAVVYGLIGALIVFRLETAVAVSVGALLGLILYLVNFYGFTELFPWFAMARNWVSIVAHVLFGLVGAAAYKQLAKRELRREGSLRG